MKLTESFLKALVEEQVRKLMLAEEEEEGKKKEPKKNEKKKPKQDDIGFNDVVRTIHSDASTKDVHDILQRYITKMQNSKEPNKEHHIKRAKERTKELLDMRDKNKNK